MVDQPCKATAAVFASPELSGMIFTYLQPVDLFKALQVSNHFRAMRHAADHPTQSTIHPHPATRADQPCEATAAVFALPELSEIIFMYLPPTDLITVLQVSKQFRTMVHASPELMRRLFLEPAPNKDAWLLEENHMLPYSSSEHPYLHRHFGINADFVAATSIGSVAQVRHQGPQARVVQFNPWLVRTSGRFSLLARCRLRSYSRSQLDFNQVLGLNCFVHSASTKTGIQSGLNADLRVHHVRQHRLWLSSVLEEPRQLFPTLDAAFVSGNGAGLWMDTLLTQPPVRKVTLEIALQEPAQDFSRQVGESIVREIEVEGGVRLGHLVVGMTSAERQAIETAERVVTLLFLHDVVEKTDGAIQDWEEGFRKRAW